jgi:uncharacterized protein YndB with AHSA1/START domain
VMSRDATAQRVIHGSFTVTAELDAPPDQVLAAYSEPELRRRWFRVPGGSSDHELDVRVGGHEAASDGGQGRAASRARMRRAGVRRARAVRHLARGKTPSQQSLQKSCAAVLTAAARPPVAVPSRNG